MRKAKDSLGNKYQVDIIGDRVTLINSHGFKRFISLKLYQELFKEYKDNLDIEIPEEEYDEMVELQSLKAMEVLKPGKKKKPKVEFRGMLNLKDICEELDKDPKKARAKLKRFGYTKPYTWSEDKDIKIIKKLLKNL